MTNDNSPSEPPKDAETYWLFKATATGVSCLGIQVFSNGDYWVYDSPTGTYAAGHADKGKWRAVYDQYLAEGYVTEPEAKAAGLVPASWSRQPPSPPWAHELRLARLKVAAIFFTVLAVAALFTWFAWIAE